VCVCRVVVQYCQVALLVLRVAIFSILFDNDNVDSDNDAIAAFTRSSVAAASDSKALDTLLSALPAMIGVDKHGQLWECSQCRRVIDHADNPVVMSPDGVGPSCGCCCSSSRSDLQASATATAVLARAANVLNRLQAFV
jgi:hypothetical protein